MPAIVKTGPKFDYDLIVIGGKSSAGLACAKAAASLGKKVVVINYVAPPSQGATRGIGKTFVNVGCISKRLLLRAALSDRSTHSSVMFGLKIPEPKNIKNCWVKLVQRVQCQLTLISITKRSELQKKKVEYVRCSAKFRDKHTIQATLPDGNERILTGEKILIALGKRPLFPDIPGAVEYCITSDDVFVRISPPGKTMIIGAGHSGIECAAFLQTMGHKPTVMVRSVVLRGFDRQMANVITDDMESRGVKFLFKCIPLEVQKRENGKLQLRWKSVETGEESQDEYDTVLIATGRRQPIEELEVTNAGVIYNPNTHKIVTANAQTNIPNIYTIADVFHERYELIPFAIRAGELLASQLFGENANLADVGVVDYKNIPTTVFTPLEYSCIGLTEEAALRQFGYKNIEVHHALYYNLSLFYFRELSPENRYCLKIVCMRTQPRTILGMHMLGSNTEDVIERFIAAVLFGMTVDNLKNRFDLRPVVAG